MEAFWLQVTLFKRRSFGFRWRGTMNGLAVSPALCRTKWALYDKSATMWRLWKYFNSEKMSINSCLCMTLSSNNYPSINYLSPLTLHSVSWGAGAYPDYLRVKVEHSLDALEFIAGATQRDIQPGEVTVLSPGPLCHLIYWLWMNETQVVFLSHQIKKEGHCKTDLVCSLKGVKPFISQCVPRIVELRV